MNIAQRSTRSQLFTVHLWQEDVGDDCWEWRGMVKHVTSGEVRYFRDWSVLRHLMLDMLPEAVEILDDEQTVD